MNLSTRTVNLAGREIGCSCHACAFFHTDDQFYKVLLPFIREGFAAGDRAVHIVDPAKRDRHVQTLSAAGIDAERSQDTRQLEVRRWEEAYLREGHFDQDAMLALIQEVLEDGRRQKFPMTRLVANMEWALEDRPGVRDIVEYESRLNYILPEVRRHGRLHLRSREVQRVRGDGYPAHAPDGHRRRGDAGESVLHAAGPAAARAGVATTAARGLSRP